MTGRTTLRLPFALLFITALLCRAQDFPGTDTVSGRLLASEPTTVTDPLDFSGLASTRLPLVSQRAFSWTDVRISLQGSNVTDTYQPGRTIAFPDPQAVGDVVLRGGLNLATSPAYGTEIVLSAREPGPAWHGRLSSGNTGSPLASSNLPPLAERGMLQQPEHYRWFTREGVQAGGPLGKRADLLLSGVGQWASQTVPQARPGEDLNSRLISGDARGRVQLDQRNQLEASFDTTHIFRSNWGTPAGLEALAGYRMSPSFTDPAGFSGLKEMDSLGSLRAGYTRGGAVQVRYGFSRALLNTTPTGPAGAQSVIDLVGAVRGDTPPLTNRAARTRHQLDAVFTLASGRHRFLIGGGWERAGIVNGWSAPSNLNLITALGVPDFVVMLNTPTDSRSHIQAFSASVRDEVRMAPWLAADIALVADIARGGTIAWNSASPRAGLSLTPLSRLTLRGSYSRTYAPLAGRYLDYGNAASLGGTRFQWIDRNADGLWQPSETSRLLGRFGGPYSNIDRDLRRPHADQFDLGAEASLPRGVSVSLRLFRRDEKARIAAVNVGVPPQAFSPVQILDPGPDAKPGTFDDRETDRICPGPVYPGPRSVLAHEPARLEDAELRAGGRGGRGCAFCQDARLVHGSEVIRSDQPRQRGPGERSGRRGRPVPGSQHGCARLGPDLLRQGLRRKGSSGRDSPQESRRYRAGDYGHLPRRAGLRKEAARHGAPAGAVSSGHYGPRKSRRREPRGVCAELEPPPGPVFPGSSRERQVVAGPPQRPQRRQQDPGDGCQRSSLQPALAGGDPVSALPAF